MGGKQTVFAYSMNLSLLILQTTKIVPIIHGHQPMEHKEIKLYYWSRKAQLTAKRRSMADSRKDMQIVSETKAEKQNILNVCSLKQCQ